MPYTPVPRTMRALPELLAGMAASVPPAIEVGGVALDSRKVRSGDLFLACQGLHQHGLDHVDEAIAAGTRAVVWDAPATPELPVPGVQVPDLPRRVGTIAARFWQEPSRHMAVTGITGTDGKTSCAHLLAQALDAIGMRCGYLGTLGCGFVDDSQDTAHTTPDAVTLQALLASMRARGARAAALEVSSHALAQYRVDAVDFDVAVLTNIGRDHLDYHGDVAHYAAAKRRLFDLPGLDCAVLNGDDEHGRRWLATPPAGVRTVAYGLQDGVADLAPEHVAVTAVTARPQGLTLQVQSSWGELAIDSSLIGRFNAANLAAVLAVLLVHEIRPAEAVRALAGVRTVPGRMEQVPAPAGQPLVVVDYAHTPNALEQALQAVRAHAGGRVHCVFGCGGDRDRGKRPLMGSVAARLADVVWLTDDNPRDESPAAIVADIQAGIEQDVACAVEHDRVAAIERAIRAARAGDVVLIAGKGHEGWQQTGAVRRRHDDRAVARQVLEVS